MDTALPRPTDPVAPTSLALSEALRFWLKLGFISFGGPAGQIALMHEEPGRSASMDFREAISPCPELLHAAAGARGSAACHLPGVVAAPDMGRHSGGVLFVLPSLFIIMALAWLYMAHGDMPLIAGFFYGIKPAVTALVAQAACRVGSRSLKSRRHWGIAAAAFLAIFTLNIPFPLIVIAAAAIGFVGVNCIPKPLVAPAMKKAMRIGHSVLH